jgi:catechol 2,3-dioxygenase-like lactoylglutathione lyase family enzyme
MLLNHVTLIVANFERSKAFYQQLGLIQIVDSPPRYARFRLPEGDATLSIEATGERRIDSPDLVQLYFECPRLDDTVAALKRRGFVFHQEPTDMPYLWREARLRDPDDHEIRLYFAGENRLNPPWKIVDP